MKKIVTSAFVIFGMSAFAQDRAPQDGQRSAATSGQTQATPLPYDVNDKYMGRKDEFLNLMIVKELPADFPEYKAQWGVKEYNAVVDAYFMQHMDLLKERAKQKIQYLKDQQQTK